MSDKTGTTLTAEIRQALDMVGSDFVSDAEILALINTHYADLYDLVLEAYGQWYYAERVHFNTVAGSPAYSFLPDIAGPFGRDGLDLYKMLGVDLAVDADRVETLTVLPWAERNRYNEFTTYRGRPKHYRLHAQAIALVPTPDAVYSATIHYVPRCPTITSSTALLGVNGWETYVVYAVCAVLAAKEQADTTIWLGLKQQVRERLERMRIRDVGHVQKVADVRGVRRGWRR